LSRLDPERDSQILLERLTAMGIQARLVSGGRSVLASLRLQSTNFPGLDEPLRIEEAVFSTVGLDTIKCLEPRALFQLPLIRIMDCRDSTMIEARIHLAWKQHVAELDATRRWLRQIGAQPTVCEQGSLLQLPLEPQEIQATLFDRRRVILPSKGPLQGVTLQRVEDRAPLLDRNVASALDQQMVLSTRMEELARTERRLEEQRRHTPSRANDAPNPVVPPSHRRRTPVLMVGPRLANERSCIESLRLRGYEVHTANSERDGIMLYDKVSPELVLCDFQLGRSDGTDFILSLRRVFGVEEIPVVLVDTSRHEGRRDVAQRVGAAGYLIHPVDVRRIEQRIQHMVLEPRRRRFTRYKSRLPIQLAKKDQTSVVTALGRGGLFLSTPTDLAIDSMQNCRMTLPELGRSISFQAQVLYQSEPAGTNQPGIGIRFQAFESGHERVLLQYLRNIDSPVTAPP